MSHKGIMQHQTTPLSLNDFQYWCHHPLPEFFDKDRKLYNLMMYSITFLLNVAFSYLVYLGFKTLSGETLVLLLIGFICFVCIKGLTSLYSLCNGNYTYRLALQVYPKFPFVPMITFIGFTILNSYFIDYSMFDGLGYLLISTILVNFIITLGFHIVGLECVSIKKK